MITPLAPSPSKTPQTPFHLGVAHGDPAGAHELSLDQKRLYQGRASAEDRLEGFAPSLAHVLPHLGSAGGREGLVQRSSKVHDP